jgi:hypothetical protein
MSPVHRRRTAGGTQRHCAAGGSRPDNYRDARCGGLPPLPSARSMGAGEVAMLPETSLERASFLSSPGGARYLDGWAIGRSGLRSGVQD